MATTERSPAGERRRRRLAAGMMLAACCGIAVPLGAQLPPARVEGIAALVGGRAPGPDVAVILRSDVVLRARLSLSGAERSVFLRPLPPELLRASLEELIGEALIAHEARRIRSGEPRQRDLREQRARLVARAGGAERFSEVIDALGVPEGEVSEIVRRRAIVAVFLASNLDGATVITGGEVDAALAAAGHSDPASVPAHDRRLVAAALADRALSRTVERWVRVLRARVPVRVYTRFDGT